MIKIKWIAAVLLATLVMTSTLRADEKDVKNASIKFITALSQGQSDEARKLVTGSEGQMNVFNAMAENAACNKLMSDAAVATWGAEGTSIDRMAVNLPRMTDLVAKAAVKIDGDKATIAMFPNEENPVTLKLIDGQWKFDLDAIPNKDDLVRMIPKYNARIQAAKETTSDIKAGKFKTLDEAKDAYLRKVNDLTAALSPATTQPDDADDAATTMPAAPAVPAATQPAAEQMPAN